jgi:hypothetical protein
MPVQLEPLQVSAGVLVMLSEAAAGRFTVTG